MSGAAVNEPGVRSNRDNVVLGVVLCAAIAIVCLAIVGVNWSWTGFKGNETLWDWMSMFAAPLAIASLPVRIAAPDHVLVRRWRFVWPVLLFALAIAIAGGYGLGWTWTGFQGQALWDWLHLLLLPTVAVFLPDWFRKGAPIGRVGAAAASVLFAGFVLVIFGGYYGHWAWTGFEGNTFHDWLDLLIAPFLLPTACRWFQIQWSQRAARLADTPTAESSSLVDDLALAEAVPAPEEVPAPAPVTEAGTRAADVAPAEDVPPEDDVTPEDDATPAEDVAPAEDAPHAG